jgi:hypothetical protein
VGVHGIAWAALGRQRISPPTNGFGPKVPVLGQTLTFTPRSHSQAFLNHENIRFSFLWINLWKLCRPLHRNGPQPRSYCLPGPGRPTIRQPARARTGDGGKTARQPVSRVLSAPEDAGRPFLWDTPRGVPHATNPGGGTGTSLVRHGIRSRASPAAPIRSCSRWGLPCRPCCQGRGALLPHRFALARGTRRSCTGGLFSVALSLGSPPPAVSRHRIPVEPGLSSTSGMTHRQRPSSCLARAMCAPPAAGSSDPSRAAGSSDPSWAAGSSDPSRAAGSSNHRAAHRRPTKPHQAAPGPTPPPPSQ